MDPDLPKVLVGNKSDLERKVDRNEAESFALDKEMVYFETSAKDNTNINEMFECIMHKTYLHLMGVKNG